jgi:DNA-binding response OmpR family regulator
MSPALYAAPSEQAPIGARPLRILVADDERDFVLTLMLLLRDEGYEVRGVYDGTQVLESARGFQPDVVILDIGMPNLNGYDTARALRLEYGNAMVLIAVTAYDKAADKILAKMAGFDHHFGKPFDPQALTKLLSTLPPKGS